MIVYYTVNDPEFSDYMSISIGQGDIDIWGYSHAAEICAANYQSNSNWEGEHQNDFYLWSYDEDADATLLGKFVVYIDYEPFFTAHLAKPEVPVEKQVTAAYVESLTPYMTKPK
jgi:hypothetical protein